MGLLEYFRLKIVVFLVRLQFRLVQKHSTVKPDSVLQITSRDAKRFIKSHVYKPVNAQYPTPVLLNFHGSGFVLPYHGSDDEYCRCISTHTDYTVLDVQYRLAPENPFPAALEDVEDAVKYIFSKPNVYDPTRLSISGFSAGANLSLAASSMILPRDTFRTIIAFYPPTDLATSPYAKSPPDPTGKVIPPWLARIFDGSYFGNKDPRDPRISPFYAPAENFPSNVLVVTAAMDYLAGEGSELAERISRDGEGIFVVSKRIEGCGHAWDKMPEEGSFQAKMKDEAYGAAVKMLRR